MPSKTQDTKMTSPVRPWAAAAGTLLALLTIAPVAAAPVTIAEAIALAEKYSPRVRLAAAEIARARSGTVTARTYPNPEIEALAGGVRARVPGVASGPGLSVIIGQPLDLPFQREPRIRAAEAGVESARHGYDETLLLLRTDVKQAYYAVLRRRSELALAVDNQKLLEETRNRIALSVNVGERAKFELVRIDAELAGVRNQTASARLRVSQALAQLKLVIGASPEIDLDVTGELRPFTLDESLEALYRRLEERHPALRRVRAEVARAENRLSSERALRLPRPTLRAGVDREPEQNRTMLGLSVPIPLWDQRRGPIGDAVASLQQASLVAEQQRLVLRGELDINYNRLLVARQQIAAYEGGLIRQAENALRVAESAFRYGERGFLEVLDAQRVLRTVRAEFLAARFDKQAAIVEIERLTASEFTGDSP
jgi:cobalt-zinc-cadmium efflux system outer membrane protein